MSRAVSNDQPTMQSAKRPGLFESSPSKLQWLSLTFSGVSIVGLCTTSWHPDSSPKFFAFSLTWIINVVVFVCTRDHWLRMEPSGFRLAPWERAGRIYQWAGVDVFRWLLLRSPLNWLGPTPKLTRQRPEIERLLRFLNCAEGVHRVGGMVTLGISLGYITAGHVSVGLYIAVLTLLLHAYPVMLQRRNRGRILRIARRLDALQR